MDKNKAQINKLKFNISKKQLYDLYWNREFSIRAIAKKIKQSYSYTRTKLLKFQIPLRIRTAIRNRRNRGKRCSFYKDGRTLKKYYCKCGEGISVWSALYGSGLCGSCAHKGKNAGNYIDGRSLKKYYCIDCLKKGIKTEISYRAKRCQKCWFQFYKGYKRSEEAKKKMSLGHGGTGIPYENREYPEEFYKIRPKIRKRDSYVCQKCFEYGNHVHHIDYNKKNCEESNLITLCNCCNIKANYNRDYWHAYFMYVMENWK